jgi:ribonuclease E
MANKMLIDASHPEETRVVVLRGNKVQEFDFEAADKKPLRGNIYLAKVTRVEPSLQAAFVDYGGNRHGFLAFAEIHPDYYQIPVADRLALLEEESQAHLQAEEEEHRPQPQGRRRSRRRHHEAAEKRAATDDGVIAGPIVEEERLSPRADFAPEEEPERLAPESPPSALETPPEVGAVEAADSPVAATPEESPKILETEEPSAIVAEAPATLQAEGASPISVDPSGFGVVEVGSPEGEDFARQEQDHEIKARRQDERDEEHQRQLEEARGEEEEEEEEHEDEAAHVEHIGGDAMEEVPYRAARPRRQYKIQEVIKRRQVLLVQVVKEERGNKGAALTTYLSLAGRFSVLMPNTARGGGISRKITDGADRKRLKEIVQDLDVPEGMGVILRTAGATRTRAEVKRDFEYLLRLWESVRELTLRSSAPTLVYEEGSLIKRAIRDLYSQDVDEVTVSGAEAHREAQDFMRMLMPSHVRHVKLYREAAPIFAESGVEAQLDAMFSNQVTLKSGGYLVINQTEALVAIDVNSGRSTREHNIEDTALRTNLEAADEVARQLRLRDLAGLIVVDFIDMEESRNNRAVERRIKDALKNDRARIQVGRISHFGLLEMSRQRIRAGVVEGSTAPCPHCAGAGTVRSTASVALHVLRVLEEALVRSAAHDINLRTRAAVALYILNQKRNHLQDLERRFGVHITVSADDSLTGATYHALERGEPASGVRAPRPQHLRVDSLSPEVLAEETAEEEAAGGEEREEAALEPAQDARRGRGRRERGPRPESEAGEAEPTYGAEGEAEAEGARPRRRRRRRGRGGAHAEEFAPAFQGARASYEPPAHLGSQPSDEGLAFMAQLEGQPAPTKEAYRPGRGRGPGRWKRSAPLAPEFRDETFPPDERAEQSIGFVSPSEAHVPPFSEVAPAQEAPDAEASAAPQTPPETTSVFEVPPEAPAAAAPEPPALEPAPETPAPAEPAPAAESAEVVITQPDPSRPKKGGWWQRARATLGGEE